VNPDDRVAERLRGFGPLGVLALFVILAGNLLFVPLSGLLVLAWAWRSGTPWQELGPYRYFPDNRNYIDPFFSNSGSGSICVHTAMNLAL